LADLQSSAEESLRWNRCALAAAEMLDETIVSEALPGANLRSFYPSLHLNLAEDYRLMGDVEAARHHAREARTALSGTVDEGLVRMIRGGVERIERTLTSEP